MKKPVGFLRVFGAAALVIGLLAATMAPVMAQDPDEEPGDVDAARSLAPLFDIEAPGFLAGSNAIFYPWVANDDDFGLGPADTSISVQNLEERDAQIFIYVGDGAGGFELATTAFLAAWASKTFSAAQLGIAEGEGAPVAVLAFTQFVGVTPTDLPPGVPAEAVETAPAGSTLVETPVILSNPIAEEGAGGEFTQVVACVVNFHTAAQPDLGNPHGYVAAVEHTFAGDGVTYAAGEWVPGPFTQQELQDTLNAVNEGNVGELINPFGGLNNDGDCFDVLEVGGVTTFLDSVIIGGVAKQAVEGEGLPMTSEVDTSVSGYNAINGSELAFFDQWYLPIVQTNCGPGGCWDSTLRVANLSGLNAAVTVRFFPADDGSGSLQTGFQLQELVDGGATWNIDLSDFVPEGWVGSAHILSDGAVFAMVDRYKVGYNMWITNTGSSADFENIAQIDNAQGNYVLFAPHVLLDYFGWNTGINVANLVDQDNNVSIQYFNVLGQATEVMNQRLAAHGMTYFYDPSIPAQDIGQDPTAPPPFGDPNAGVVGSALIWSDFPVAAAIDGTKYPETDPLGGEALDVFQAISYNATQNVFPWQAVPLVQKGSPIDGMGDTSGINIMNPNSTAATANVYYTNPSGFNAQNFGTSSVTIPAFANGFVYTMTQHNLPNGFTGSAVVVANVPVVAASATVNYEVQFDGAAIFNAFNPCGFYRVAGECFFGDPFDPTGRSVTKTFVDTEGNPVPGVSFSIVGGPVDFPYQRDGFSGVDGSQIFTNVPVGDYELFVTSVPPGYVAPDPNVAQDTFTVTQGEDVVLENILEIEDVDVPGNVIKTVLLDGEPVEGATVEILVDAEVVETAETDVAGIASFTLEPGTYELCSTVVIDEEDNVICEEIEVIEGEVLEITNEHGDELGQIDITTSIEQDIFANFGTFEVCLWTSGSDTEVDDPVDCLDVDAGEVDPLVNGFFFANVPSGTYFLTAFQAVNGSGFFIVSNDQDYDVLLDLDDTFIDDIENEAGDSSGVGDLREDGEWDWIIDDADAESMNIILGPGQGDGPINGVENNVNND